MTSFDRKKVTQAAREIARTDWLGGYRRPPSPEWARTVVEPHIGTDVPEAIEHAANVYRETFEEWLKNPEDAPRRHKPKVLICVRWCDLW